MTSSNLAPPNQAAGASRDLAGQRSSGRAVPNTLSKVQHQQVMTEAPLIEKQLKTAAKRREAEEKGSSRWRSEFW